MLSCRTEVESKITTASPLSLKFNEPPEWSKTAIWYQIYVERFRNGDKNNDPRPKDIEEGYPGFVPETWSITPWTHDWYKEDPYFKEVKGKLDLAGEKIEHFNQLVRLRRYGGDLQGVIDKIDYLDSLGINAIYFNPLNDAPTDHKYDARNWRHIDRNFGPNPDLDLRLMKSEVPDDPSTWLLTSADSLFLKLVNKLHERDIKVIMDYSWNHTGIGFWAYNDIIKNQESSKYKDWYWIKKFDDPSTPNNEFEFFGWFGLKDLVQIKETVYTEHKEGSYIFDGNLESETLKTHIFNITRKWLDPNSDGDTSDGIDGYRLDVAAELPLGFWREYRQVVRNINPDAYLIGETWFEVYPNSMMDPKPMLEGDVFDAVMNYRWYKASRELITGKIKISDYIDSIHRTTSNLKWENNLAMMNVAGSHDTPRLSTSFYNDNSKYKLNAAPTETNDYKIDKPSTEALQNVRMLLALQYTFIGAPHIWAGDEMGMWGADMGDARKPIIWPDYDFEPESIHPNGRKREVDTVKFNYELYNYYRKLISLRKNNEVLSLGKFEFVENQDNDLLVYERNLNDVAVLTLINTSYETKSLNLDNKYLTKDLLQNALVIKEHDKNMIKVPARSPAIFSNTKLN